MSRKSFLVIGSKGLIGSTVIELLNSNGNVIYSIDILGDSSDKYLNISQAKDEEICSFLNRINFTHLDGLVDCSYYRPEHWGKRAEELTESEWNLSLMALSKNLIRFYMPFVSCYNQSVKNLVLIGSIYGSLGYDDNLYEDTDMNPAPEYLVTKAGLLGLMRLLAQKGSKNNVLVNAVSPGGIANGQPELFVSRYSHKTLLGRMARPTEVANLIEFFLTKNSYVTGQNVLIDGGYSVK